MITKIVRRSTQHAGRRDQSPHQYGDGNWDCGADADLNASYEYVPRCFRSSGVEERVHVRDWSSKHKDKQGDQQPGQYGAPSVLGEASWRSRWLVMLRLMEQNRENR